MNFAFVPIKTCKNCWFDPWILAFSRLFINKNRCMWVASPPCPARKPKQCASLGPYPLWHRSRDPTRWQFDVEIAWKQVRYMIQRHDSDIPNIFAHICTVFCRVFGYFWSLLFVLHVLQSEVCKWSIHWTFACQQRRHTLNVWPQVGCIPPSILQRRT